ncbi:hypothetical protein PQR71_35205 [Paraburkholderia fungorum]|uniref:hypothetical protein n=1 Tax=Paraburkholderia fungorum TaxID=134537 RepID=UPI0038B79CB0
MRGELVAGRRWLKSPWRAWWVSGYAGSKDHQTRHNPHMPADKLGRFMTSKEFLRRANAAVVEAVRHLEARGIKPVYLDRKTGRITGDAESFARRPLEIRLPDATVGAVLGELFERGKHAEFRARLEDIAATPAGAQQINNAIVVIASSLLLCKTAMPYEADAFARRVSEQMASIREHAALVELAFLLIEGELNTQSDSFRDRNVISDALFQQRIEVIKQALQH